MRLGRLALTVILLLVATTVVAGDKDPYLWLEEVEGEKALEWVEQRSDKDTGEIKEVPEFGAIHEQLLEIYNSSDRIPYPRIRDAWIYNFWQDKDHVRGIWRRTSKDEYINESPVWETVLDLDVLAEEEDENWVWKGANGLPPDYTHFMIRLSRGGGDAAVVREFDGTAKAFVEDGFYVPEAKSRVGWMDENTLWIGTDFGEGSLTSSGYPRLVKVWKRDTPLESAETVFEGSVDDVSVGAYSMHTPEGRYDLAYRTPEFFRGTTYLILGGRRVKLDIPEDAELQGIFKDHLLISLRTDWTVGETTYPQDALLAIDLDRFLSGERDFSVLFQPEERIALGSVSNTQSHLLVTTLDNVRSKLYKYTLADEEWTREEVTLPGMGSASVTGTSNFSDTFYISYTDFLTPSSLYVVRPNTDPRPIKSSTRRCSMGTAASRSP
jgi:prolyl oligopeptidase